jgi:NADH-quinone oxidoreductase subunit J
MEILVALGDREPDDHGIDCGVEIVGKVLSSRFSVLRKTTRDLRTENWELRTDYMLHLIIFLVFGVVCVAGAVNLLVQSHPINSALSLIAVMVSLAVEYLLLGAEFVAAVQVIIYAGAIMVLFVLVIMLLNAGAEERTLGSRVALIIGIPGMLVGSGLVAWVLVARSNTASVETGALWGDPKSISRLLFHDFLLPFEVTSVLVLIAIMGAVVLAAKPEQVQSSRKEA